MEQLNLVHLALLYLMEIHIELSDNCMEGLLLVVPFIQRLGFIKSFVTLKSNQPGPDHLGHTFRQLGLSSPCRTLDQYWLSEPIGEVNNPSDAVVGQVTHSVEGGANLRNVGKTMAHANDRIDG